MKSLLLTALLLALCTVDALAGDSAILRQKLDQLLADAPESAAPATRVENGPPLRKGSSGPRVQQLRDRLRELGYEIEPTGAFDTRLQHAVERFQDDSGLAPDGIVDRQTRFNLNLSEAERIRILRAQLPKMEEIEAAEGNSPYLVVNIPAFTLHVYDADRQILESRVIVGRPQRPTPLMRSELVGIKYNPPWVPPPTIVKEDILKEKKVDPAYLEDHGLLVLDAKGRAVAPANLTEADLLRNGYRFYQPPGDNNALGRLKFELENSFSVYLHDTNQQSLFRRENRAFSSGCVRVEKYRELAAWLTGGTVEDIEAAIRKKGTRTETIAPVPVYFVYWLADVVNGKVVFFSDIYRQD